MIEQAQSQPVFSPRAGFVFLCFYLLAIAFCIAVPRALTFLPTSVALIGLIYLFAVNRALPAINKNFLGFILGFGGLACLSALWSPDPAYSFEKALKVTALLLSGLIPLMMASALQFTTASKLKIIICACYLCALAGAIIFFEFRTQFSLSRILLHAPDDFYLWPKPIKKGFFLNRSTVFLVLLCIPVLLMVRTSDLSRYYKNALTVLLVVCVGAALTATNSQTAQIAGVLALPMLFFPAAKLRARRCLAIAVLIAMLGAPFIAVPAQKYLIEGSADNATEGFLVDASIPHRIEVWKFMSEQIMKAPILGHGIEATRDLRAGYVMKHMRTDQVLHPHNAVLQIWVEFGMVGIAIAMGFVCFLFCRLDTMPAVLQRYHTLLFIVLLGVLSMGYGLWQAWLIGMIQTLVAFGFMGVRLTGADIIKDKNPA